MNGVIGFTDVLLESRLNEEQLQCVQTIRNCGEGLLALIDDVLDFSKIESGHFELESVRFSPGEVANSWHFLTLRFTKNRYQKLSKSLC